MEKQQKHEEEQVIAAKLDQYETLKRKVDMLEEDKRTGDTAAKLMD